MILTWAVNKNFVEVNKKWLVGLNNSFINLNSLMFLNSSDFKINQMKGNIRLNILFHWQEIEVLYQYKLFDSIKFFHASVEWQ